MTEPERIAAGLVTKRCPVCGDRLTLSSGMFQLFRYECCGVRMKSAILERQADT